MSPRTAPHAKEAAAAQRTRRRTELLSLLAALLVLMGIALHTISCGDDDLIFPGEIPFTATPAETDTPDPNEEALLPPTPVPIA